MTEWVETTLADISERIDYGFTASALDDPNLPRFLRITDIARPNIDWASVPGCKADASALKKYALSTDDIVVARTGATVGYAKRIRSLPKSVFASYLVRFRLKPAVAPGFVGGIVESQLYKDWVQQNAGGAAQPNASAKILGAYPIQLPDRATQDRIGSFFDAAADLIETNRRRVQVLEDMARAIYREWFVKFRYPGNGLVPLVESALGPTPEDWDVVSVGDAIELRYGKALKADDRAGGSVAVVGSSGVVGWHDVPLIEGPSIVVGRKGNVGSIIWLDGPSWPIDTTYFVRTQLPLRFVAEQLRGVEFINSHSAVPGLSREMAYSKPFLIPQRSLLDDFQGVADDLGAEASALMMQSKSLGRLRDLLLPKLVTGQIDVSTLDLEARLRDVAA